MTVDPIVGRIVWWYGFNIELEPERKPEAAMVTDVLGEREVNLCVFGHDGTPRGVSSVHLKLPGDDVPGRAMKLIGYFADWSIRPALKAVA